MVSRAVERTGSDRHRPLLTSGIATSIGSLPHRDAREAAAFVLATHPDLPAAPQLPRRSPRERMVAQAAAGIDGVSVAFRVAGRAVAARAAALVRLAGSVAPDVPLVVFIDEPGLGAAGHPGFPLPAERVVDLLAGSLGAAGPAVATGVHCCANSGW